MYTLEGVSSVANFITAYEESEKKMRLPFSICDGVFLSKRNRLDFLFILVCVKNIHQRVMTQTCRDQS